MTLFKWIPLRKKHVGTKECDCNEGCPNNENLKEDPELADARERMEALEKLADARIMAGIEWERDLQSRDRRK